MKLITAISLNANLLVTASLQKVLFTAIYSNAKNALLIQHKKNEVQEQF